MEQHREDIGTKADLSLHRLQTAKDAFSDGRRIYKKENRRIVNV